ncbi:hypothetical protein E4U53_005391 [Claviceps sorghi]|nr:hypothetical protein E4U53_005391 [Claviceps sorghi]
MQRPDFLPNLTFHKVDAEKEAWPCDVYHKYDYIYLRYVISCFDSTQTVFRRAFENLEPGGWIEIYDACQSFMPVGRLDANKGLTKWLSLANEGGLRVGRDLKRSMFYAQWLREAGFVNVTETKFGTPCHSSALTPDKRMKKLCKMVVENELRLVDSLGNFLRNVVPDEGEARKIEEAARRDIQNPDTVMVREINSGTTSMLKGLWMLDRASRWRQASAHLSSCCFLALIDDTSSSASLAHYRAPCGLRPILLVLREQLRHLPGNISRIQTCILRSHHPYKGDERTSPICTTWRRYTFASDLAIDWTRAPGSGFKKLQAASSSTSSSNKTDRRRAASRGHSPFSKMATTQKEATGALEANGVRVAIEGCGHGTLNAIYDSVGKACKVRGWDGVDILIIGGDFQAVRNAADLSIMSCPVKYRHLGDFPDYYAGIRKAPYLTIFVGGNHEASSHLWELYYGGWVAPNIYYMGAANVLRFGPLRIAGMSGIWKGRDYRKPHHERLPFNGDDIKSFYHVREVDVRKLLLMRTQVDIGISHDWPRYIENHGDSAWLFRKKPDFRSDAERGQLGSTAAEYVMDRLRPPYWFSAHMHIKFAAIKRYEDAPTASAPSVDETDGGQNGQPGKEANPDEIDLDIDDDEDPGQKAEPASDATDRKPEPAAAEPQPGDANDTKDTNQVPDELRAQLPASFAPPQHQYQHQHQPGQNRFPGQPVPPGITNKEVRFLALDKCLPGRHFLQTCCIEPFQGPDSPKVCPREAMPRYSLEYDPEWLAITRVFHDSLTFGDRSAQTCPDLGEEHYLPLIQTERAWVEENIVAKGKLGVPENFEITAPPHVSGTPEIVQQQPDEYTNPQTAAFCDLLGLKNLWDSTAEERLERKRQGPAPSEFQGRGGKGGGRGGHHQGGRGGSRGRGRGRGRW